MILAGLMAHDMGGKRNADQLLSSIQSIYRREAAFLEMMLSKSEGDEGTPFSRN